MTSAVRKEIALRPGQDLLDAGDAPPWGSYGADGETLMEAGFSAAVAISDLAVLMRPGR